MYLFERKTSMRGQLPLKGLRVLDFASFIADPVATTVMGDYGAGLKATFQTRVVQNVSV